MNSMRQLDITYHKNIVCTSEMGVQYVPILMHITVALTPSVRRGY